MHLALLRGVNVGGRNKVAMADLRRALEQGGFDRVSTYINSGNVMFDPGEREATRLTAEVEAAIEAASGFHVDVLLWDLERLEGLVSDVPPDWVNDAATRCDVLFLWPDVDDPATLERVARNPEVDEVVYLPGALVWRIDRALVGRSKLRLVIGTDLYRRLTIRNATTVRTLLGLMRGTASGAGRA